MPGGVCAVLDYEVELMADYVSEMATRVVMPRSTVNAAFRKFVTQILTSTRLPSTTILLGMNYLAKRINMMHAAGQTSHTEGQVWRMLTIALLLGSKFLDDNTFQNKSWSEVSGISVKELNTMEYEWLGAVSWSLYVNLDQSKDYNAWLANWQEWLENKKRQRAQANRDRMAMVSPIDTDLGHSRNPHLYASWHQQQVAEYERLSSLKRSQPTGTSSCRREYAPWPTYSVPWHAHSAPLTPPDSGYGTPEYANSATSLNSTYNEWFDRAVVGNGNTHRHYPHTGQYNAFNTGVHSSRSSSTYPAYYNHSHNIWEPNSIADCNCVNCAGPTHNKPQSYFLAHNYGQPVVG